MKYLLNSNTKSLLKGWETVYYGEVDHCSEC
ncbi:hypothetical protein FHX05_000061 [Rhizobium sp. BK491]|nr:hypothetical protein [Rhizobium sp. BK491]